MVSTGEDDVWRALAQASGRDPGAYALVREWRKSDRGRDHVVRQYEATGDAVIFKQVHRPADAKAFQVLLEAQVRAAEAMKDAPDSVPEVLEFDAEARAVLMRKVAGQTVYDLVGEGRDAAECLRRAGRWMAAFHRATFAEQRVFQPKFMRNHLAHLLQQHRSGEITLAAESEFCRHATAAIDLADAHERQKTVSAATHGDMNLRNIMIDGSRSFGIDFSAAHNAPVGFDIARLLLHHAGVFADLDEVPEGEVIAPHLLAAFFEGYDLVQADDPSVQYLLRVRLLMDWASLPARVTERSLAQGRRLSRLREMAQRVFG